MLVFSCNNVYEASKHPSACYRDPSSPSSLYRPQLLGHSPLPPCSSTSFMTHIVLQSRNRCTTQFPEAIRTFLRTEARLPNDHLTIFLRMIHGIGCHIFPHGLAKFKNTHSRRKSTAVSCKLLGLAKLMYQVLYSCIIGGVW